MSAWQGYQRPCTYLASNFLSLVQPPSTNPEEDWLCVHVWKFRPTTSKENIVLDKDAGHFMKCRGVQVDAASARNRSVSRGHTIQRWCD